MSQITQSTAELQSILDLVDLKRLIIQNMEASFTSALLTKLNNITDLYKGLYATSTDLNTAYPSPSSGWSAWVTGTGTMWSVSAGTWVDTGSSSFGDMLASTYDPQAIGADSFLRTNHTGMMPSQYAACKPLLAQLASSFTAAANTVTPVPISGTEGGQLGSNADWTYDATAVGWVVPITGTYMVSAALAVDTVANTPPTVDCRSQLSIRVYSAANAGYGNFAWLDCQYMPSGRQNYYFLHGSRAFQLAAGTKIRVEMTNSNAGAYSMKTTPNPDDNWVNAVLIGGT